MALFLGHSRRVYEHHYRIQMGHYGLVEVFKRLASMQKQPFAEESTLSMANSPDNNSKKNRVTAIFLVNHPHFSHFCSHFLVFLPIDHLQLLKFNYF